MTPGFLAGRIVLQLLVFFGLCYSLFNRSPRIFAPIRTSQSFVVEKNSLQLSKSRISSSKQHDTNNDQGDIDSEDPYSEGFENQPEWLELFPRKRGEPELLRDYPDFVNLEPNDPLFLDMPWPTKAGPEATAFGKHMQWRRGLSDGERLRWQKWAVYERLMDKHHFKYSLDDYIVQNIQRDIKQKADAAGANGFRMEESMWKATARTYSEEHSSEVTAVMMSLYSAFNRKNYDELRALWLPDESVELTLSGYEKARGQNEVQKMYRKVIKDSKPFGAVEAKVVSVSCNGFIAVVQTVETIVPGTELKAAPKKNAPVMKAKPAPAKRVFATTVLRKFNQQWRVTLHHASRFTSSPYTGDQKKSPTLADSASSSSSSASSTSRVARVGVMKGGGEKPDRDSFLKGESRTGPPITPGELQSLLKDGSLLSVSRMNKDGGWEKVVALDNDLDNRNSSRGSYVNSEDMNKRLSWAKQMQSDEEGNKSPRRIRLGNDGNLYLGDDLLSTTTEKERAVLQELEDSTAKMNSFISTSTSISSSSSGSSSSSSSSKGAAGVKSRNSVSSIKVTKEGGVGSVIDENASVNKQAIQALRFLFKAGRISRQTKEILMMDIIDNVVDHETSLVVVAFMLLAGHDSKEKNRPWREAFNSSGVGMEEFADQCSVLVDKINGEGGSRAMYGSAGASKQLKSINSRINSSNSRKSTLSRPRYDDADEDEEDDDDEDEDEDSDDDSK